MRLLLPEAAATAAAAGSEAAAASAPAARGVVRGDDDALRGDALNDAVRAPAVAPDALGCFAATGARSGVGRGGVLDDAGRVVAPRVRAPPTRNLANLSSISNLSKSAMKLQPDYFALDRALNATNQAPPTRALERHAQIRKYFLSSTGWGAQLLLCCVSSTF